VPCCRLTTLDLSGNRPDVDGLVALAVGLAHLRHQLDPVNCVEPSGRAVLAELEMICDCGEGVLPLHMVGLMVSTNSEEDSSDVDSSGVDSSGVDSSDVDSLDVDSSDVER
jgi:hypothetical protein